MQINSNVNKSFFDKNIWHGLKLTDSAVQQIRNLMKHDTNMLGLRVNVKQSGCAGFSYIIEKVFEPKNNDLVYEHKNVKLYVPLKTMPFVDGTELDYRQEGLNCVFKFNNPKVQHICGCGESFGFGAITV
ncbi:Fe-S cluster assembly scaffold SufA [Candidatus Curculioniphilus buchneri]|uniref:Fe-S cluster assembly scaffold SufA n=1 Tax=Candidatus Curculioniphilus buchneri TaxID=690594 RepID=UPI00376EFF21